MTASRECKDRFEDIVALVMGELSPDATRKLADHVGVCERCQAFQDALVREERAVRTGFEALARNIGSVEQGLQARRQHASRNFSEPSHNRFRERVMSMFLAHKRVSLAAVAMLVGSVILYVSLFPRSTSAYAMEQTAEANTRVTSYHVKITPAAELGEAWIELNADGTPLHARMDLKSRHDGAKVVILTGDKAEVWLKDKGTRLFVTDNNALKQFMAQRSLFDPKLAFEELQARQKAGEVQVATKEPAKKGEPIALTVTSEKTPDRRRVYDVDPETKLVERVIEYRRRDEQWQRVSQQEYLDYNKRIDPRVFQLDVPKNVVTVDQTKQKVGLEKGTLTDEEIATKLAREFVAAVVAEDFQKAGTLVGGMPAKEMQRRFKRANIKLIRIVTVGEPTPNPKSRSIQVPVTVEMEVNGKKSTGKLLPSSRAVHGDPDRWEIIGGI
ncbi:MAG: hypothetical protein CMJ48_08700 [Planctomycetaceae bacterium]|nr:hypothetical protein [Planctomycetaceae bacterium]